MPKSFFHKTLAFLSGCGLFLIGSGPSPGIPLISFAQETYVPHSFSPRSCHHDRLPFRLHSGECRLTRRSKGTRQKAPSFLTVAPGCAPLYLIASPQRDMQARVTVRNAALIDQAFAYDTRELVMRTYVEQTWGKWNQDEAKIQIADDIRHWRLCIIELDGKPAGMMRIDEHSTHLDIDQLFLRPETQGLGIGTPLVQRVLARAEAKKLPVRLWVLRINPARALYERLGFVVFEETAASLHPQRCCNPSSEPIHTGVPLNSTDYKNIKGT